jgi:hypothetical protein
MDEMLASTVFAFQTEMCRIAKTQRSIYARYIVGDQASLGWIAIAPTCELSFRLNFRRLSRIELELAIPSDWAL